MNELEKAARQALKALEKYCTPYQDGTHPADEAITALRRALEQPAQQQEGPIAEGWQITVAHGHSGYGVYAHMEDYPEEGAVLVMPIEQPAQQEPVATVQDLDEVKRKHLVYELGFDWKDPLYTSPPASKPWVQATTWRGLTDEERGQAINANFGTGLWAMAKDIEAKLREKNA